ncbi:FAD-binding oxidoreductase [Plantactinospora sp. BB1]|uniref:FAD-binding oxidoreductase n=1 Tax=Plantactinospora sp. BB1 TaxID=2071627 RepID=UPI0035124156
MTKVGEISIERRGGADIARRLAGICGAHFARPAGAADGVAGTVARWVAAPGNPEAVTEVVRLAAEHDLSVVPRGAGTKLDWGMPPSQVDIVLDTGRLAGVWQQPEDELVAEIGAGTPVRAAEAILERTGRRLPIDVPSVGATLGGVVAANESGPLRHLHGPPLRPARRGQLRRRLGGARARPGRRRRRLRGAVRPGAGRPRRRPAALRVAGCARRARLGDPAGAADPGQPGLGGPFGLDPAGGARPGAGRPRRRAAADRDRGRPARRPHAGGRARPAEPRLRRAPSAGRSGCHGGTRPVRPVVGARLVRDAAPARRSGPPRRRCRRPGGSRVGSGGRAARLVRRARRRHPGRTPRRRAGRGGRAGRPVDGAARRRRPGGRHGTRVVAPLSVPAGRRRAAHRGADR